MIVLPIWTFFSPQPMIWREPNSCRVVLTVQEKQEMKTMKKITLFLWAVFALAACSATPNATDVDREPPTKAAVTPQPVATMTAPVPDTTPLTSPGNLGGTMNPVVDQVIHVYAEQNALELATIQVISYERVDWPDGCLGVVKPGMMCTEMITPGYRILLNVAGRDIELRTTLQGGYFVVAPPGSPDGFPVN